MEKPKADLYVTGAAEVVTCAPAPGNPLGRIAAGCLAAAGDRILAVGSPADIAARADTSAALVVDACGGVVAPGFVDCHTHLVFGGSRSLEYAAKMTRTSAEVSAMGIPAGIPATVAMTRETASERLVEESAGRLSRMFASGSTTIESKSGYGLNWKAELKQLQTNRRLSRSCPVDLVPTFLGAHDFPVDMPRDRYVDLLVNEMIPAVAEMLLAEFCDVYCDQGYYTVNQTRRILEAGRSHGLKPKIHADAYSATGIADVAIELGAASMDHLNYTTPEEMKRLAKAGVVGVGLPALDFAVAHPDPVHLRAILESGMTLALATNLNPGNWTETMHFVMVLACRRHRLSPEEAMLAATSGAAAALGRSAEIGALKAGMLADIQIWDIQSFEEYIYRLDRNPIVGLIKRGKVIFAPSSGD
ncbi:MAG: imidazolonepropionase [Desulfobacterales bacterium]